MQNSPSVFTKDKRAFFKALQSLDEPAIRFLSDRLSYLLKSLPGVYLIQKADIEELRNDAVLVTLKKIADGDFVFQEYDPLSYTIGVARKLLANMLRKRKPNMMPIENHELATDFSPEKYLLQKEAELQMGELLKGMGKNCEQVIRLKYYDNLRDQTVIEQKLSIYSTIDSLKNKRSQCLRKLAELVKGKGFSLLDLLN